MSGALTVQRTLYAAHLADARRKGFALPAYFDELARPHKDWSIKRWRERARAVIRRAARDKLNLPAMLAKQLAMFLKLKKARSFWEKVGDVAMDVMKHPAFSAVVGAATAAIPGVGVALAPVAVALQRHVTAVVDKARHGNLKAKDVLSGVAEVAAAGASAASPQAAAMVDKAQTVMAVARSVAQPKQTKALKASRAIVLRAQGGDRLAQRKVLQIAHAAKRGNVKAQKAFGYLVATGHGIAQGHVPRAKPFEQHVIARAAAATEHIEPDELEPTSDEYELELDGDEYESDEDDYGDEVGALKPLKLAKALRPVKVPPPALTKPLKPRKPTPAPITLTKPIKPRSSSSSSSSALGKFGKALRPRPMTQSDFSPAGAFSSSLSKGVLDRLKGARPSPFGTQADASPAAALEHEAEAAVDPLGASSSSRDAAPPSAHTREPAEPYGEQGDAWEDDEEGDDDSWGDEGDDEEEGYGGWGYGSDAYDDDEEADEEAA